MLVHAIGQTGAPLDANTLIEDILSRRPEWTRSEIARRIGRSHTTIGRKTKTEHKGARVDTLNALIRLRDELIAEDLAGGLSEPEVEEIAAASAPPELRPTTQQIVVRVRNRALEHAGILPGDLVLFQIDREPKDGEIALVRIYDEERGDAESVCRRFVEPDYLMVATADPAVPQRPLRPGRDPVAIRGTMVRLLREVT